MGILKKIISGGQVGADQGGLDAAICKSYAGDGERKRVFLDELDPEAGRYEAEPDIACSTLCGEVMERIGG